MEPGFMLERGDGPLDLQVRWVEGEPTPPPVLIEDANHGAIRNSEAAEGSRRLVHVAGAGTSDVTISGIRLPPTAVAATFATPDLRSRVRVRA
jgi:hypothetical protein